MQPEPESKTHPPSEPIVLNARASLPRAGDKGFDPYEAIRELQELATAAKPPTPPAKTPWSRRLWERRPRNRRQRTRVALGAAVAVTLALAGSAIHVHHINQAVVAERMARMGSSLNTARNLAETLQSENDDLYRKISALQLRLDDGEEAATNKLLADQKRPAQIQAEAASQREKLGGLFTKIADLDLQTGLTQYENRGLEGQLREVHNRAQELVDYIAEEFPDEHSKHWKFLLNDPNVRRNYRHH